MQYQFDNLYSEYLSRQSYSLLTQKGLAVEGIYNIVGVTMITELHKAKAIHKFDFPDISIAPKQFLNVPFTGIPWKTTDVNSGSHCGSLMIN